MQVAQQDALPVRAQQLALPALQALFSLTESVIRDVLPMDIIQTLSITFASVKNYYNCINIIICS